MSSTPVSHPPLPQAEPAPDAECTVIGRRSAALPRGTRLGEYELTDVVGQGGFGIVYLAWDHFLACRFAIKEYMPAAIALRGDDDQVMTRTASDREVFELGLRSFVNEAQMLAGFDHPALVKVYRFWQANGTAYMLMPYYEGPTLKEILDGGTQAIDEAWLRTLLRPLADALELLHAAHCFHRDIAPDNIKLRSDTGLPVLLDFGAARRVIGDMKRELTAIYKPGYAPIEQREDSAMEQGPWTDVYALAAVLYRAIAGALPPSPVGRLAQECYVPLARQASGCYDARFLAAIDHALQVRPHDRTPSMAAFRAELGLDAPVHEARDPSGDEASSRPATQLGRSTRLVAIVLACATLAGGAASWWWARQTDPLRPSQAREIKRTDEPLGATSAPAVTPQPPASQPRASTISPPPASTGLEAFAPFDRVVARQAPGFVVKATARKPLLRVDRDALALNVNSPRDGHVVVLLRDADGSLAMLFPNAAMPRLTVRHERPLDLPRLMSRKPVGRQQLLVVVSSRPVAFGDAAAVDQLLARWSTPACEATSGCGGDYGAVRLNVDIVE
jgi:serine/threonine protein kinase